MCCGVGFFFEIKASCSVISAYYLLALPYFVIWFELETTLSRLLRSFCVPSLPSSMSATPHVLVKLMENLLVVSSVPLSLLLAKMLHRDVPNTNPWGLRVVSGLFLDISHWLQFSKCDLQPIPHPLSVSSIKSMSPQCSD